MSALRNPAEARWRRLFSLGEWEVYLQKPPNKHGWSCLVIRLLDPRAGKRSWWLNYHHARGLARHVESEHLARSHPLFVQDLLAKLRRWPPQP